jgi:predicted nucleotidyltransferase
MITKKDIIETLKKEMPYFKEKYGVKRIGLFGSCAKGDFTETSDVDIIVEFEKPIGFEFMDFTEYIENILGRKVDVITSAGLESIRIKEVQRDIVRSAIYV